MPGPPAAKPVNPRPHCANKEIWIQEQAAFFAGTCKESTCKERGKENLGRSRSCEEGVTNVRPRMVSLRRDQS